MMLGVLGSVAEFERNIMLERQRSGISKAKAEGRYVGRQPTARRQAEQIDALLTEGFKPSEVAEKLGIRRTSVWRHQRKAA